MNPCPVINSRPEIGKGRLKVSPHGMTTNLCQNLDLVLSSQPIGRAKSCCEPAILQILAIDNHMATIGSMPKDSNPVIYHPLLPPQNTSKAPLFLPSLVRSEQMQVLGVGDRAVCGEA